MKTWSLMCSPCSRNLYSNSNASEQNALNQPLKNHGGARVPARAPSWNDRVSATHQSGATRDVRFHQAEYCAV